MCLQLQTDREVVLEDPCRQISGRQFLVGRRKQDRIWPAPELLANDLPAPLVVDAIGDHKLELVVRLRVFEVMPAKGLTLVAAGGFDVYNFDHQFWDPLDIDMSETTVVFLFMGEAFNLVMRPLLWQQLKVGARVVSNDFSMGDWKPDRTVRVDTPTRSYVLYLWTITDEIKRKAAAAP